ncbi:MAG: WG repeat-containing protein [Spirochaetales bacterium]|nr:WG repeat-containing protein [Spirochaetales bacterium]
MRKSVFLFIMLISMASCVSTNNKTIMNAFEIHCRILSQFEEVKNKTLTNEEIISLFTKLREDIQKYINLIPSTKTADEKAGQLQKSAQRIAVIWDRILTGIIKQGEVQQPLKYHYLIYYELYIITHSGLGDGKCPGLNESLKDFWMNNSPRLLETEGDAEDPNNYFEQYMIKLLKDDDTAETALANAREKAQSNKNFVYNQDIIEVYLRLPDDLFDPEILKELLGLHDEEDEMKIAGIINDYTDEEDLAEKIIENTLEHDDTRLAGELLDAYLEDGIIETDYYNEKSLEAGKNKEDISIDVDKAYPIRKNNKWGFVSKNGRVVIKPAISAKSVGDYSLTGISFTTYDSYEILDGEEYTLRVQSSSLKYETIGSLSEGYARVYRNGLWGFINDKGREVVNPGFDEVSIFSGKLAGVKIDNKWGFIDTKGKIVIGPIYDEVRPFQDMVAWVKLNNKYGYIDTKGNSFSGIIYEELSDYKEDYAVVKSGGKYGFIDKTGKVVIEIKFNFCDSFSEGLAAVKENNLWGYIDKTGRMIIEPIYDEAGAFTDNIARVQVTNKYGFIDKEGKKVIDTRFEYASTFSEGFALVSKNQKYGFIDSSGNIAVDIVYDYCYSFSEGRAVVNIDDKYGIIDTEEKFILKPEFNYINSFSEGFAAVKKGDKWGYVDRNGRYLVEPKFDYCYSFSKGKAEVTLVGKAGLLGKDGNYLMKPDRYDSIQNSSGEDIVASIRGKTGLLNKKGKVILEPSYDTIYIYSKDLLKISSGNKYGLLNARTFTEVIPVEYGSIYTYGDDGYGSISRAGKYGFIDENGHITVEPLYDNTIFYAGDIIRVKKDEVWGLINYKTGETILEPSYLTINAPHEGLACFEKKSRYKVSGEGALFKVEFDSLEGRETKLWGFMNEKGEVAIEPRYFKAYNFSEGLCLVYSWVGIDEDDTLLYMSTFINREGKTEIYSLPSYDYIWVAFKQGVVKYQKDGLFGLIDKKGKIRLKAQFEEIENFTDSSGLTVFKDDNWYGLINNMGEIIVEPQYQYIYTISDGVSIVKKEGRYFFLDHKTGKRLGDSIFEEYYYSSSGFHRVLMDGKYGFVNSLGKIIIEPQYKNINDFSQGLAAVKIGNKWGFIDLTGYLVIKPQFDEVDSFYEDISRVKIGNKTGYINRKGKYIWEPVF